MSESTQAFPGALPNDGYVDIFMMQGNVSRYKLTQILLGIDKGTHFSHKDVVLHLEMLTLG
jgi:hypothetical protein